MPVYPPVRRPTCMYVRMPARQATVRQHAVVNPGTLDLWKANGHPHVHLPPNFRRGVPCHAEPAPGSLFRHRSSQPLPHWQPVLQYPLQIIKNASTPSACVHYGTLLLLPSCTTATHRMLVVLQVRLYRNPTCYRARLFFGFFNAVLRPPIAMPSNCYAAKQLCKSPSKVCAPLLLRS